MENQQVSVLTPLDRAYRVDDAINTRENHLVIIRFGEDGQNIGNPKVLKEIDDCLTSEAQTRQTDVKVYTVAMKNVPELVARYKLSGYATLLFFANNVQVDRLKYDSTNSFKEDALKTTIDKCVVQQKEKKNGNNNRAAGDASQQNTAPPTRTYKPRSWNYWWN